MRRAGIVIVAIAILVPGVIWASEALAVDRCLDAGGVFDYRSRQCNFSAISRPYISFTARHRLLVVSSISVALVGVALFSVSGKRGAAVA